MEIIIQGRHTGSETVDTVNCVLKLLQERYQIDSFREIHVSVTLVDGCGQDVELVDNETNQRFGVIDVCSTHPSVSRRVGRPALKLVIDNTEEGGA